MNLTWLGHSAVLVETGGVRVVADPLLRRRIGPLLRAAPLPPLGPVDAVLISHLHHDHCDLPSLRRLAAPVVVAPPGAAGWLGRHGVANVVPLRPGRELSLADGVTVTAVPARHDGRREPFGPRARPVGHVVRGPDRSTWLAGDTALYAEMADLHVDVAAVPVWGWGPKLGPGHLDPRTAAEAVARSGARHAVPVHWGTLYPAGLHAGMRARLRTPGPEFAAHLTGATAHVLPVGGTLTL